MFDRGISASVVPSSTSYTVYITKTGKNTIATDATI